MTSVLSVPLWLLIVSLVQLLANSAIAANGSQPLASDSLIFAEQDGMVAVEAEHFFKQSMNETRAHYLTSTENAPDIEPDHDPSHAAGASGGAYLEILPDTRVTHDDKLIRGTNFAPQPGKMAIVHYKVQITKPGRYYVWVRAFSTGTEDNGLHVGIDGTWPESGQRLQWAKAKQTWRWDSMQRTNKVHTGVPHQIYLDIEEVGEHEIHFSMREDGFEFDKWLMTTNRDFVRPDDAGPPSRVHAGTAPEPYPVTAAAVTREKAAAAALAKEDGSASSIKSKASSPTKNVFSGKQKQPRQAHGDGTVTVSGDLMAWHKVVLNMDGPFAHEQDNEPNPFIDYQMTATFQHADGTRYAVPGFFAADGNAANTSADSGTRWRALFSPDMAGEWTYFVSFRQGKNCALGMKAPAQPLAPFDGKSGRFTVATSDKSGRDLRAHGRLKYVGKRYLQFAQSGKYFLKVGADAPETLLAFKDFDNTKGRKESFAPVKSWAPHVKDWQEGDPTWKDGKGKGLIGAVNYLAGKGCNAFSFLTYNAGGDGDNVWPFIDRDDKLHYDCSKLDQWGTVFDHGTAKGMYLHFKLQETENDDHQRGGKKKKGQLVSESLDGGQLGVQRRLYLREMIARFGHNLALNWNLGEENTQTTSQQKNMLEFIDMLDAYDHNRVVHTYPSQQDAVYDGLIGDKSKLTGTSLQNSSLETTHAQTCKWVEKSTAAGKPWVVAFDESGSASHAQCPDLGYQGFDGHDNSGKMVYTQHAVRKQTLWGQLMAGGAGCEYYFGYKFAENDIRCEDWRSRDQSWDYCRIAIGFFDDFKIPFWEMANADGLVGNTKHGPSKFCFAKRDEVYLVYLPSGGTTELDLTEASGAFRVEWFNPRDGGDLQTRSKREVEGGGKVSIGDPPADVKEDWLAVIRKS